MARLPTSTCVCTLPGIWTRCTRRPDCCGGAGDSAAPAAEPSNRRRFFRSARACRPRRNRRRRSAANRRERSDGGRTRRARSRRYAATCSSVGATIAYGCRRKERGAGVRSRGSRAWCARCATPRSAGGARARIRPRERTRCARDRRSDRGCRWKIPRGPMRRSTLESAPACVPRPAPMRRRSSSIWRLGREAVPVRTTVAVISARPGVRCATSGVAAAEVEMRGHFRKRVAIPRGPPAGHWRERVTVRLGQATGRSGARAGGAADSDTDVAAE